MKKIQKKNGELMKIKKILIALLSFSLILALFNVSVFANSTAYSWFIKRNGNKQPILTEEQKIICKYDAFYIDSTKGDECVDKVIYLTYDAGYENGNVEKTLDILKREGIPAAFFILDNILLKNSDLVTRMISDGHTVCNHTKNHKNLSFSSKEEIEKNLSALETLYEEKTGEKMKKYFRFPEGRYTEECLKTVSELGYKSFFWSFAYEDWNNGKQMPPQKALKKVLDNTHNGAIFLFHPTSDTNVKILEDLIREWRSLGFRFGTLDELVENMTKADAN